MTYKENEAAFNSVKPEQLGAKPDQIFRWTMLNLLFEIYSRLDSISYSYAQMLKIQQDKLKKEQAQARGK